MNDAYSTLLDIALDAASEQFRKMPSSNCWDYARHVVAAVKPLIEAQAEYITFLGEECSNNAGFLYVHGIQASDAVVRRGKELRQRITDAGGTLDV